MHTKSYRIGVKEEKTTQKIETVRIGAGSDGGEASTAEKSTHAKHKKNKYGIEENKSAKKYCLA